MYMATYMLQLEYALFTAYWFGHKTLLSSSDWPPEELSHGVLLRPLMMPIPT